MFRIIALIGVLAGLAACSSSPQYSYHDNQQYCYQTTKIYTQLRLPLCIFDKIRISKPI